ERHRVLRGEFWQGTKRVFYKDGSQGEGRRSDQLARRVDYSRGIRARTDCNVSPCRSRSRRAMPAESRTGPSRRSSSRLSIDPDLTDTGPSASPAIPPTRNGSQN